MRKPATTPDASPHRGTAATYRVAIGLALAASVGMTLWSVGPPSVSFASELGRSTAPKTSITLEDRVAALTAELEQVKVDTFKLRVGQGDAFEELSNMRASLANAEIGLNSLRTSVDENKVHQSDAAAQIASNLAQLKDQALHLRSTQDETATEMSWLRAGMANNEIGVDKLRATTGDLRQQIQRIDAARDATSSIARRHRHHGHRRWVSQR